MARLSALEAEGAVRRVMADYMRLCDQLDASTPMEALGELFTEDAVWAGAGGRYAATFGSHVGRAAIVAMLARYQGPPPHFAMNAHFLCSEAITVDGEHARGRWLMLQTSTFAGGASQLSSASLDVAFRLDADRWRIARFLTTNLFSRPVSAWDDPAPLPIPAH
jgi:ketosteroid isomerase-like protein